MNFRFSLSNRRSWLGASFLLDNKGIVCFSKYTGGNMTDVFAVIGGVGLAIEWIAAGIFLSTLLMREIMSKVGSVLRRIWRKEEVPDELFVGVLAIVALVVVTAWPILLVFPLARQRVREYFRYYAKKAR